MRKVKKAPLIGLLVLLLFDLLLGFTSGVDTYNSVIFYIVWWPVASMGPLLKPFINTHEQFAIPVGIALYTAGQSIDFVIYTFVANWLLKLRISNNESSPVIDKA